ncbi:MAG: ABC transporter substrate-binding protein [Actinomycetota bacterium]|nr:ABC transporter substrate-binding protein [Actinomycetota bacterium]
MKRYLMPVAALSALGLLAGACGSSSDNNATSTTVASKTVTIAVGGPFSGSEKATGDQIKSGAQLAATEINNSGGIASGPRKGATIVLKEYDDADEPAKAAANMRTIVDDKGLDAFVGSGLSDASAAASPVASEAGFSYLAAYASSPTILEAAKAKKSVFVVPPTFPAYSFSVTDELLKTGAKRPAIIHLTGTYGDGVADYVVQRLKASNITPVANETFGFTDIDLRPQLGRIKDNSPDSLVMVGLPASDALILQQADQLGLKVPAYDPGGITNSDSFLKAAGALANGIVGNSPTDAQRNTPAAVALRQSYTAATGESFVPDPATFSYEGVKAVAAGFADGATGRADLANHLHKISIADTGVGPLRFAPDGSRIGGRLYIFKVEDGKPVFTTGYEQTGPLEVKELPGLER